MKLTAAVVQFRTQIDQPELNIEKGYQLLEAALRKGAKLVVMPEMWVCGLYPDLLKSPFILKTAEIIEEIAVLARRYTATIVAGSHPHADYYDSVSDKRIFNRVYVLNSSGGVSGTYNKIQLFKKNHEDAYSKPGFKVFIIEADKIRIAPFVCFDLRFPELFRIAAFNGVDVICISSQFPKSRLAHWRALLAARAIENQCYVMASNSTGNDGIIELGGNSCIIAPNGETLASLGEEEGTIEFALDLDEQNDYRAKFPFLDEAILKDSMKGYLGKNLV